MLFTCSFPKNATVEAACCDKGPKPGNLYLFTIDSNNASYCAVNDDLDYLTHCLADHQVVFDECHIEGVSASTTTNQGASSAAPSRPSRLGLLLTAFLGLSLLAGVSAADSDVVCKKFTPKDKADWDVNARTEGQSITQGYVDCRGGHEPCIVGSQNEGNPPPVFSAVWDSPRGVKVDADLRPLIKSAQEAEAVQRDGHLARDPEPYPMEDPRWRRCWTQSVGVCYTHPGHFQRLQG